MSKQPEALELLEWYAQEDGFHQGTKAPHKWVLRTEAELRRLHALCAEWEKKAATWLASPEAAQRLDGYRELAQRLNAAEASNAELLAALELARDHLDMNALAFTHCKDAAAINAAIANATKGKQNDH